MSKASPELQEEIRQAKENSLKENAIADKEIAVSAPVIATKTVEVRSTKDPWFELVPSLGGGILGYGILVLFITAFLIYRGKVKPPANDGQWLIRALVVPMCVIAAVFLTVVSYDPEQMTPVIGLLGTIIGYLLGSARSNATAPTDDPDKTTGTKGTKANDDPDDKHEGKKDDASGKNPPDKDAKDRESVKGEGSVPGRPAGDDGNV